MNLRLWWRWKKRDSNCYCPKHDGTMTGKKKRCSKFCRNFWYIKIFVVFVVVVSITNISFFFFEKNFYYSFISFVISLFAIVSLYTIFTLLKKRKKMGPKNEADIHKFGFPYWANTQSPFIYSKLPKIKAHKLGLFTK